MYDVHPCTRKTPYLGLLQRGKTVNLDPHSPAFHPPPALPGGPPPVCIPTYPRTAHGAATHIIGLIQHPTRPSFRVISVESTPNCICITHRTTPTRMGSRSNPYSNNALPNLVVPPDLKPREMNQEDIPILVHLLKNGIRSHYGRNWPLEDMTPAMAGLFQTGSVVQYTVWVDQPPTDSLPRQSQTCAAQPASRQQPGAAAGSGTPKGRPTPATLFSRGKVPPHPPGVKHCPHLRTDEIVLTKHILLTQEN